MCLRPLRHRQRDATHMDAGGLSLAMGGRLSMAAYTAALPGFNSALVQAACTTVKRSAMYCAQVGHEAGGLYYQEEVWGPTRQQKKYDPSSGSDLSRQLGNTKVGDGPLYKGRGRIQLTGKGNYGRFSVWCFVRKLVPTRDYFVQHPQLVAQMPWCDLAAAWYWTAARPGLNAAADAGDLTLCTKLINGGTTGIDDRRERYERCLRMGAAILPTPGPVGVVTPRTSEDAVVLLTMPATDRPTSVDLPMESWPMSGEISRPLVPAVPNGWRGKGSISSLFCGWAGDPRDMNKPSGWIDYLRIISHPGGDYSRQPTITTVLDNARLIGNWSCKRIALPEWCTGLLVRYAAPGTLNIGIEWER